MTITESKRTTDTSTKTKQAAETSSKSSTPKTITVLRRPAVAQTSAETTTPNPDTETKPKKPTYEKRMRELAPALRLRKKLEANVKRLSKIANEIGRWQNASDLRAAATSVTTGLAAMLGVAMALPDDFKPERGRKGGARHLVPGAKAVLRPKVLAKYDGILEPEERANLEIVSVAPGGLVTVTTVSGSRLVLPRSHVAKPHGDVAAVASEPSARATANRVE